MQPAETRRPEGEEHGPPLWKTLAQFVIFNVVLFALIGGAGLGFLNFLEPGIPVEQAVAASSEDGPSVYTIEGTVINEAAREVAPAFSGKVRSVAVRKGQEVRKGQLLFRMDTREIRERLRAARRGAAATGAEVTRAYSGRERAVKPLKAEVKRLEAALERLRKADPNSARLTAVQQEYAGARARLAAAEKKWHLRVVEAIRNHQDAKAGTAPLHALLKQQNRYSPANGVVSSIRAAAGHWARAGQPVVVVEDPSGSRVVALVRDDLRAPLEPEQSVTLRLDDGKYAAKMLRTEPGTGRELFHRWVYFQPEKPEKLSTGQQVTLVLPGRKAPSARVEAVSGRSPE